MTKRKNTLIPQGDVLLTTPYTVVDCIAHLQNMEHFDLTINVKSQSDTYAELQLVERHNDDLPLYVNTRLIRTHRETKVTFELSEYLRERASRAQQPLELHSGLNTKQALLGVAIGLVVVFSLISIPDVAGVLLCTIPLLAFVMYMKQEVTTAEVSSPPEIKQRSEKIKAIMRQRADVLRDDMIDALTFDPSAEYFDALGNAYYLEDLDTLSRKQHTG